MYRKLKTFSLFIAFFFEVTFPQSKSMQIAGVTRTYIVHAPSGLNNPPLVFNIHGYNMDAASEQNYTKMDQIADREKFIVVYPNAIDKAWDLSGTDDYTFIVTIIDTIDAKYHINRDRIYSCGFSMGGFMSFQLACRYSDIFAAIAHLWNIAGNYVVFTIIFWNAFVSYGKTVLYPFFCFQVNQI